jgi:hypothetical protein
MLRKAVALVLALFVLPSTGCSLAFMQKAPEPITTPQYPVQCTRSRTAPVLDSICGGYFVANAIVLAGAKTCDENDPLATDCFDSSAKTGGMVLSAALAGLCLGSAVAGFGRASRCDAIQGKNVACIAGDLTACQALTPGWRPSTTPAQPAPTALPPQPMPGTPAQRPDGLGEDASCTATWQCKIGLQCRDGLCQP